MGTELQLHQALFGYDAGHHLLQSSLELSPAASQTLAVATDLSGSAPANGFEASFTGMPIPGTEFYALFCTWLAPEMHRPGCVWSQVLLIEVADLAGIEDLGALRDCFRRPSPQKSDRYSKPLRRRSSVTEPSLEPSAITRELTSHWLATLYGQPQASVILPADTARQYEDLVFALWSQQWPRLRRNFRFSTGSFGDRGQTGLAFDLQVTPKANRRAWLGSGEHLVIDDVVLSPIDAPSWVIPVVEDIFSPNEEGFREFLRTNGADVNAPRAAFARLARSFLAIRRISVSNWTVALNTVAKEFPEPSEAVVLKRSCVLPRPNDANDTMLERAWWGLDWIFHEGPTGAFSRVAFDLNASVATLWPAKRNEIANLLAAPPQATGEQQWGALAQATANIASGADLVWLWSKLPELMPTLVRLQPSLAANIEVWRLPERAQWRLVEALESQPISSSHWREIVMAMLTAGTSVGVKEVAHTAGAEAFHGSLHWVKKQGDKLLPDVWRQSLTDVARDRLKQGGMAPLEFAFCVTLLPPYQMEQIPVDRSDVQDLGALPLERLPAALRLPAAFFLVTVGLKGSGKAGATAIARGFFAVHSALAAQTEPPESWRLLQRQLPPFRFWEWDRCGKLRDAVREWLRLNSAQEMFLNEANTNAERDLAQSLIH